MQPQPQQQGAPAFCLPARHAQYAGGVAWQVRLVEGGEPDPETRPPQRQRVVRPRKQDCAPCSSLGDTQVGRLFGFQAFNESAIDYNNGSGGQGKGSAPRSAKAATILLASDHINTLLGSQYARLVEARYGPKKELHAGGTPHQGPAPEGVEDLLFQQAVLQLHTIVFESYSLEWCAGGLKGRRGWRQCLGEPSTETPHPPRLCRSAGAASSTCGPCHGR